MSLKEYDIKNNEISEWIPYLGLMTPRIIQNKDDSLISIIEYDDSSLMNKDNLNKFLKQLPLGISFYFEKSTLSPITTCYIIWNPAYDLKNNKLSNSLMKETNNDHFYIFDKFLDEFFSKMNKSFQNVNILSKQDVLNRLYRILTYEKSIAMPDATLYLDCYLTQDFSYKKYKHMLKIGEYYTNCIRLLGYPNFFVKDILSYIKNMNLNYRYSRRITVLDNQTKIQTQENYFKNWCSSHRSFLSVFCTKESAFYIENIIVLYDRNKDFLNEQILQLDKYINNKGIATISENYNIGDTWFSTIPGMFRSGYCHSLVSCKNISYNFIL